METLLSTVKNVRWTAFHSFTSREHTRIAICNNLLWHIYPIDIVLTVRTRKSHWSWFTMKQCLISNRETCLLSNKPWWNAARQPLVVLPTTTTIMTHYSPRIDRLPYSALLVDWHAKRREVVCGCCLDPPWVHGGWWHWHWYCWWGSCCIEASIAPWRSMRIWFYKKRSLLLRRMLLCCCEIETTFIHSKNITKNNNNEKNTSILMILQPMICTNNNNHNTTVIHIHDSSWNSEDSFQQTIGRILPPQAASFWKRARTGRPWA